MLQAHKFDIEKLIFKKLYSAWQVQMWMEKKQSKRLYHSSYQIYVTKEFAYFNYSPCF